MVLKDKFLVLYSKDKHKISYRATFKNPVYPTDSQSDRNHGW